MKGMRTITAMVLACMLLLFVCERSVVGDEKADKEAAYRAAVTRAREAHAAGRYGDAALHLRTAVRLFPRRSVAWYNLACALARGGKKKEALDALAEAVKAGFDRPDMMKKDPDLAALRDDRRFGEIVKKAEEAAPHDEILFPRGVKQVRNLPLLVFFHGMGGNARDGVRLFRSFADGERTIVYLPCGSVRMGKRRDGRPARNWRGADAVRVAARVKRLAEEGTADPRRIVVSGFSAGGAMAYWVGVKEDAFSGAVIFSSTIQAGTLSEADLERAASRLCVWAFHGTKDGVIPLARGKEAVSRLERKGFTVRWSTFDGGHRLPPRFHEALKKALAWIDSERNKLMEKGASR